MQNPLLKSIAILTFLFLLFGGLYFARGFLVPVALAALVAMLFAPLSERLENRRINPAIAAILCVVLLVAALTGVAALLSWQAADLAENVSAVKERILNFVDQVATFISQTFGVSPAKQKQLIQSQSAGLPAGAGSIAGSFFGSFTTFLVNTVLVLVYIFMFIYYRDHLKKFVIMLVPAAKKAETSRVIQEAGKVAQQYISGLSGMIVMLWIFYGIGFSIAGVESAIFFAILCGLLEIIPFIGNLTGTSLTVITVIAQGGNTGMLIGVLATYFIVQFFQTYLLEPLIVGSKVSINPLFTIIALVLMEMIWGIAGMILAIPLFGIIKIICDHVEPLKPYGFLIGEIKPGKKGDFLEKIKSWF